MVRDELFHLHELVTERREREAKAEEAKTPPEPPPAQKRRVKRPPNPGADVGAEGTVQQRQSSAASSSATPGPGSAEQTFLAQVPQEEDKDEEAQDPKCKREHDGLGEARGEDPKGPPAAADGMNDENSHETAFQPLQE